MHDYLSKEQRESYLREIFYSSFSDRRSSVVTRNEDVQNLGKYLRQLYGLVETGKGMSREAEGTLREIVKIRMRGKPRFYETKLFADYKRFLLLRGQRESSMRTSHEQQCFHCILNDLKVSPPSLLGDDWFWGTRQQLRCGEIIADTLGGMDPVFGSLLHPGGGKVDNSTLSSMRSRRFPMQTRRKDETEQEILMYHTAVHDACGYLLEYHCVGPGYNYLGTMLTVFPTFVPQSGRLAAFMFWKKLINEPRVPDEY